VIHRDVKPGNLMLTSDATRIVITDLGLAKLSDATQQLTRTHAGRMGTLRYMSPEQCQGNLLQLDGRADIYSLMATFCEIATGKPFFDGQTEQQLLRQVLEEDPIPPRSHDANFPSNLEGIILKATAKRRIHRYQTADDLADDLEAFAAGGAVSARPPGLLRRLTLSARRHRQKLYLAAGIAVVLTLVLDLTVLRLGRGPTSPEEPAPTPIEGTWTHPTPAAEDQPMAPPVVEQAPNPYDGTWTPPVEYAEPPPVEPPVVEEAANSEPVEQTAAAADHVLPPVPTQQTGLTLVKINSNPWSRWTLSGDSGGSGNVPYVDSLPPGSYQFHLLEPETGAEKTLSIEVKGNEESVNRCWSFHNDESC